MSIVLGQEHYAKVASELRCRMRISALKMKNRSVSGNEIMHAVSIGEQNAIEQIMFRLVALYREADPEFERERFMNAFYSDETDQNNAEELKRRIKEALCS